MACAFEQGLRNKRNADTKVQLCLRIPRYKQSRALVFVVVSLHKPCSKEQNCKRWWMIWQFLICKINRHLYRTHWCDQKIEKNWKHENLQEFKNWKIESWIIENWKLDNWRNEKLKVGYWNLNIETLKFKNWKLKK